MTFTIPQSSHNVSLKTVTWLEVFFKLKTIYIQNFFIIYFHDREYYKMIIMIFKIIFFEIIT